MSIQLAPEIEAGLRAVAAARGIDVDTLIATAVKAYLREASPSSVSPTRRALSRDRSAEMAWAANPDAQFFGKWMVLEGCQVVASGADPQQLYADVLARGLSSPFLIFVSPDEREPFAGGWVDWATGQRFPFPLARNFRMCFARNSLISRWRGSGWETPVLGLLYQS
jgi:hypothetical protein